MALPTRAANAMQRRASRGVAQRNRPRFLANPPDIPERALGQARLRRGEAWVNPHPELPEGEGYEWKRIAEGEGGE